ncbi:MAG: rhodanese-like domain-containing protein [Pirellulales bacterium]|nr:rhodanese-like domain-containing protein [Pirellulales bacterium]
MLSRYFWLGWVWVGICLTLNSAAGLLAADSPLDDLPLIQKNLAEKKAILIDVRSKKEWDAGHLRDAVHLPLDEIKAAAKEPAELSKLLAGKIPAEPADLIIYVHCAAGVRSKQACKLCADLPYKLEPLRTGYEELLEAGFAPAEEKQK